MRMELVGRHAHSLREERVLTIVGHTAYTWLAKNRR
jgi:hypothetical protein